ncbi:hypothetical protein LOC68_20165 [Blastopirellula sp. JC732]|uniref:Uncharacterized protein n=1 Tax=Blastopirellula sediminis TaxID=2894196 RepID=A0A9X1SI13_9BACT|nr:hypothetical protein [Blastopirellula sediminis]MCC9605984.1 hypothetical protein [Blastopirellula sediminis]MCC9630717.1 hypothetical protein [Blastopirellula sediminis]
MSESFHPESLSPFEARLAQLTPRSAQVDRDEVLFEAGRQAAFAEQRGVLRKWYVACAALAVATCGQSIWLLGSGDAAKTATLPPPPPQAVEQTPPTPEIASAEDQTPTERIVRTEAPVTDPVVSTSQSTSFWAAFLSPSAVDRRPTAAAGSLSVGSSVKRTMQEVFVVPKPVGIPFHEQSPLSSRSRDWSPD